MDMHGDYIRRAGVTYWRICEGTDTERVLHYCRHSLHIYNRNRMSADIGIAFPLLPFASRYSVMPTKTIYPHAPLRTFVLISVIFFPFFFLPPCCFFGASTPSPSPSDNA